MEKRKVTMKDIAEKVGVSAATVSYVLNFSQKEKISHETRLNVFQAAKELGYIPNMAAKALAGSGSQMVGIVINLGENNKRSKIYSRFDLANELQQLLSERGFDTVLLSTKNAQNGCDMASKRSLEGVFVIGSGDTEPGEIAKKYFVPVVFLDEYLEDPLFYKIITDYRGLIRQAKNILQEEKLYLVTEDHINDYLRQVIEEEFSTQDVFINRKDSSLEQFLQVHSGRKGIILEELLALQAERFARGENFVAVITSSKDTMLLPQTKRIVVSNRAKAEMAVAAMEKLMNLEQLEGQEKTILISPACQTEC